MGLLVCWRDTPPLGGPCRYLSRLLLIHGRWSYMRNVEVVQYSFYKNLVNTLAYVYLQCVAGEARGSRGLGCGGGQAWPAARCWGEAGALPCQGHPPEHHQYAADTCW
jgi:hypothetical protein